LWPAREQPASTLPVSPRKFCAGAPAAAPEDSRRWDGCAQQMVRVGPYELGATLGRGNYGLVKLAVHRESGEQYAVKIVKKEVLEDETTANVDIKREIAIMKALDHPNIVALNDVLYSPKRVFMVMELVRGGELFESIVKNGRQDEDTARKYFHQLIDAVHYCHHRGVYHRDLKPENLLLGEHGELKVRVLRPCAARALSFFLAGRPPRLMPSPDARCSPPLALPAARLVARCE
jgi:serine/threonine protein kinase